MVSIVELCADMFQQNEKTDRKCFSHDRLNIYNSNAAKGIDNEFTMDDIRGASAAIFIAGNDTVFYLLLDLQSFSPQN